MIAGLACALVAVAAAGGLTVDDALQQALVDAPTVAAADAAVEAAQAGTGLARAWSDPTVGLGTSRYSAKRIVSADWTLPPASYAASLRAASADRDLATAERASIVAELLAAVEGAWTDLWAAEQRVTLLQQSVTDARAVREAAAARVEAGDVPRTELLAAEATLALAEADATGGEADRRAAAARLAVWVRGDADLVAEGAPHLGSAGDLEALRSALGAHPTRAADEASVVAATARRRAAVDGWVPEVSVGTEVDAGDPGLAGTDVLANVAITVPVGGGHGTQVARATAEQRAAEALLQAGDDARSGRLEAAVYTWDAARSRLAALDDRAVPAAVESASLAREAYAAGEIDLVSVLSARSDELAAKSARIDAAVAVAAAHTELNLAAGVTDVR